MNESAAFACPERTRTAEHGADHQSLQKSPVLEQTAEASEHGQSGHGDRGDHETEHRHQGRPGCGLDQLLDDELTAPVEQHDDQGEGREERQNGLELLRVHQAGDPQHDASGDQPHHVGDLGLGEDDLAERSE
jgi:hypothetical protein